MSIECLKCGHLAFVEGPSDLAECPKCGVIYKKYEALILPKALALNVAVEEYARDLRNAEAERKLHVAEVQRAKEARERIELEKIETRQQEAAQKAEKKSPVDRKKSVSPSLKTAPCRTCGGLVAIGAKVCPHCGQAKPATKPPTQVTKTHVFIALILVALFFVANTNQSGSLTAKDGVQICVRETGIDPNSSRAVTMQDIRALDACLNKYGFKTKP